MNERSLVVICPAGLREPANQLAAVLGWQTNLNLPCSPTGQGEATHYAIHSNVSALTALVFTGEITPELPGTSAAVVAALRSQLMISLKDDVTGSVHFDQALASHGLKQIFTSSYQTPSI